MAELTFAKQFLTLLDSKPIKLPSDYVADPRKLPAQSATILPRNPHPFPSRPTPSSTTPSSTTTAATPSTATTTITLTSLRPSSSLPSPLSLPPLDASTTSIYDVKSLAARATGYAPDKLKLLWKKKPLSDAKTLAEVIQADDATERSGGVVEMQVMFMGGPTASPESLDVATTATPTTTPAEPVQNVEMSEEDNALHKMNRHRPTAPSKADIEARLANGEGGDHLVGHPSFWRELDAWLSERFGGDRAMTDEVFGAFWRGWVDRERRD